MLDTIAYILLYILCGVVVFNIKLNLGHFDDYNVFENPEDEADLKRFIDEGIVNELQHLGLICTGAINIIFWPLVLIMTIFKPKDKNETTEK